MKYSELHNDRSTKEKVKLHFLKEMGESNREIEQVNVTEKYHRYK